MKRLAMAAVPVVAMLLLLMLPRPARAHAELKTAKPAPGATLRRSPETIRLTFSEPLGPTSSFVVYGEGFEAVTGIEPALSGPDGDQLTASIPPLTAGTYTVQWNVTGQDGHPSSGSYAFAVGARSGAPVVAWLIAAAGLIAVVAVWIARRRRKLT